MISCEWSLRTYTYVSGCVGVSGRPLPFQRPETDTGQAEITFAVQAFFPWGGKRSGDETADRTADMTAH